MIDIALPNFGDQKQASSSPVIERPDVLKLPSGFFTSQQGAVKEYLVHDDGDSTPEEASGADDETFVDADAGDNDVRAYHDQMILQSHLTPW